MSSKKVINKKFKKVINKKFKEERYKFQSVLPIFAEVLPKSLLPYAPKENA